MRSGFRTAFNRYGLPARVLTDNGAVFTGKPRRGGQVALEAELVTLRIRFDHSRPYHPQTCGKSNGSTRPRRSGWPPSHRHTPSPSSSSSWTGSAATTTPATPPSAGPQDARHRLRRAAQGRPQRPVLDPHYRVRTDKIDTGGTITLRHDSRLHHIGLGQRLAGTRVYVLTADLHIR